MSTKKPSYKLWLLFKPQFARTQDGTATLTNEVKSEHHRQKVLNKTLKSMEKYKRSGRIFQAKIFRHPGNELVSRWHLPFEQDEHEGH